jgi:hypothetical protein
MAEQGLSVEQVAAETGKQVDHVQAVLEGYPNTTQRPTPLDTFDEVARAVGLKLDLTPAE